MAAIIATVVFILLGVFQIIVALGAPYGQYVWGGQHKVLPKGLRVGSVIAVGYFFERHFAQQARAVRYDASYCRARGMRFCYCPCVDCKAFAGHRLAILILNARPLQPVLWRIAFLS